MTPPARRDWRYIIGGVIAAVVFLLAPWVLAVVAVALGVEVGEVTP